MNRSWLDHEHEFKSPDSAGAVLAPGYQSQKQTSGTIRGPELASLVRDLHEKDARPGWMRVVGYTLVCFSLLALALYQSNILLVVVIGIALGIVYSSFMMLTHDAIHHTLTGSTFFDEVIPRMMSWWLCWPHGTYSSIHRFHHSLNGRHEDDPERVHMTTEEYAKAHPIRRFLARHQLLYRILICGGLGMIAGLLRSAFRLAPTSRGLRRQLVMDSVGILCTLALVFGIAAYFGLVLEALVIWIICERTVGGVQQLRSHVEHYGLWDHYPSFIESQIYNTRNIRTNSVTSFFFNGLNYHSVHHAFPSIPFYHLKEAHERIREYCDQQGAPPLNESPGYTLTALSIIRNPTFVEPISPKNRSQHETGS